MNEILSKILQTGTVQTADGRTLPLHSHLQRQEGEILQAWITETRPQDILEIGLAYGVSSLFICDATETWNGVRYHIIDGFQNSQWAGVGIYNLERAGFGHSYQLHEELSEICLPKLLALGLAFDFALIDGWHTFDHALLDFFYVNRMLKVGGVVVFDDVHLPSIKKVLSYVSHYDCYESMPYSRAFRMIPQARVRRLLGYPEYRIVGLRKIRQDSRNWDWYKEF